MIDQISDQEWERALAAQLDREGWTWHGNLPADVFFGVWASLAHEAKTLVVILQLLILRPM